MTERAPWQMNADFTIRGLTEEECNAKRVKLIRAARRIGIGDPHTDASGPMDAEASAAYLAAHDDSHQPGGGL